MMTQQSLPLEELLTKLADHVAAYGPGAMVIEYKDVKLIAELINDTLSQPTSDQMFRRAATVVREIAAEMPKTLHTGTFCGVADRIYRAMVDEAKLDKWREPENIQS